MPTEVVIIGISPKSFGAYYVSQREDEGFDFLDNKYVDEDIRGFLAASAFPGDFNNTNWLISAEMARRAIGADFKTPVDIDRYQIIQILQLLREQIAHGKPRDGAFAEVAKRLSRRESMILDMLKAALSSASAEERTRIFSAMSRVPDQYPPSGYSGLVDIGQHRSIADAIAWLRRAQSADGAGAATSTYALELSDDPGRNPPSPEAGQPINDAALPVPHTPGVRIAVTRGSHETLLKSEDFEDFEFFHGDKLSVVGLEGVEHTITPDQCVHLRATNGRIIRIPPVMEFTTFREFNLPNHILQIAGDETRALNHIDKPYIDQYREHMGIFPSMTFLDFNSGIGCDMFHILGSLSASGRYVGLDLRSEAIAWCQKNIAPRHPNASFHHLNVRHELFNPLAIKLARDFTLPIENNSVDRVSLGSLFTHLLEDEISYYLREIRRVLRADGQVYGNFFLYSPETINAANRTNVSGLRFEHPHAPGCFVQHAERPKEAVSFTDEAIQRMIARAGLELVKPYIAGAWSGRSEASNGRQEAFVLTTSKRSVLKSAFRFVRR